MSGLLPKQSVYSKSMRVDLLGQVRTRGFCPIEINSDHNSRWLACERRPIQEKQNPLSISMPMPPAKHAITLVEMSVSLPFLPEQDQDTQDFFSAK